jgi:hypothetical protein
MKQHLTLRAEVQRLIAETEGYEDALQYVHELRDDLTGEGYEYSLAEVVWELRRQLGMPAEEETEP